MSTKQHPGPHDCYAKLADDEPYFVLRAKDPFAPELVELWAGLRKVLNGDYPKLTEARECAAAMRQWRAAKGADKSQDREATLLSGEWIPADRLSQIRLEFASAGFRAWSNPVDVDIAVHEKCARCDGLCGYEGFEGVKRTARGNVPQRWSLAVCTACGAGLSL